MHRFYIEQNITGSQAFISDPEQLHHLRDVLRLKVGSEITILDAGGNAYLGSIAEFARERAVIQISQRIPAPLKKYKITIACAVPKKSAMDDIIDKLTQLDVDTIIPLQTERVIVKLENNPAGRLERWRKIARSAAEQSQRSTLPEVSRLMDLKEVLAQSDQYDLKLIPTLNGARKTLKESLNGSQLSRVLVLIGPEGDFTPAEIEQAVGKGFQPISLGDTVLRVETAAIVIASFFKLMLAE
jgi:16S rRNA (uracil1498-N3)-methyltransferase